MSSPPSKRQRREEKPTPPCHQVLHNSDLLLRIAEFWDPLETDFPMALTCRCFYLDARYGKPVLRSAATNFCTRLPLLRWALTQTSPRTIDARLVCVFGFLAAHENVDAAVRFGNLELLIWMLKLTKQVQSGAWMSRIPFWDHAAWKPAAFTAAREGHIPVLEWLRSWQTERANPHGFVDIEWGPVEPRRYFWDTWNSTGICQAAAEGGKQQVIEWALGIGLQCKPPAPADASSSAGADGSPLAA